MKNSHTLSLIAIWLIKNRWKELRGPVNEGEERLTSLKNWNINRDDHLHQVHCSSIVGSRDKELWGPVHGGGASEFFEMVKNYQVLMDSYCFFIKIRVKYFRGPVHGGKGGEFF